MRYLGFITGEGIQTKKLFKRRSDQEDIIRPPVQKVAVPAKPKTKLALSANIGFTISRMLGQDQWLKVRLICRLFDDVSYSMANVWRDTANFALQKIHEETKEIMVDQNALITQIETDIAQNFKATVSQKAAKERINSFINERKTCFRTKKHAFYDHVSKQTSCNLIKLLNDL